VSLVLFRVACIIELFRICEIKALDISGSEAELASTNVDEEHSLLTGKCYFVHSVNSLCHRYYISSRVAEVLANQNFAV